MWSFMFLLVVSLIVALVVASFLLGFDLDRRTTATRLREIQHESVRIQRRLRALTDEAWDALNALVEQRRGDRP